MTGHTILNANLKDIQLEQDSHILMKESIFKKYEKACRERERAQALVEKFETQLRDERKEVKRHEEIILEEKKCRVKLHRLLRINDDLHMDDWTDYSVQVWIGEWEEDMECQDNWKQALQHAKYLLNNKS